MRTLHRGWTGGSGAAQGPMAAWRGGCCLLVAALGACGGGGGPDTVDVGVSGNPPSTATGLQVADESLVGQYGTSFDLLGNDRLNGRPVSASEARPRTVSFRLLSPAAAPAGLQVGADGTAVALWDVGRWVLDYEVCEVGAAAPGRCAQGRATLQAQLGQLSAAPDAFRLHTGGAPGNVLANDAARRAGDTRVPLRPGLGVEVSPLGALPKGVTLSSSGDVAVTDVAPVGKPLRFAYAVCSLPLRNPCATTEVTVERPATTLLTGETYHHPDLRIEGRKVSLVDSVSCEWGPRCQRFSIEVGGAARWLIVEQVAGQLRLPLQRVRTQGGHHVKVPSEYWAHAYRPERIDRQEFDALFGSRPFWETVADAQGRVQQVHEVYSYQHTGQADTTRLLTELDGAEPDSRVELLQTYAIDLRLTDGSGAASVQGGVLRYDFLYSHFGDDPPTYLPDEMSVLRYDEPLQRWTFHARAERSEPRAGTVRVQGPFTGPGLWAIGRVVPAVSVSGCVVDSAGRPVANEDITLLTMSSSAIARAIARTDLDGRFSGRVPAGRLVRAIQTAHENEPMLDRPAIEIMAAPGGVSEATACLVLPREPAVTIDFVGAPLSLPELWTGDVAQRAQAVIDTPEGQRRHGRVNASRVGTYRLYHPRSAAVNAERVPGVTVRDTTGMTRWEADAGLPLDDGPGHWHAYDVDVAADCRVTVRPVGVLVATLPMPEAGPAVRCVEPD